jgi:hypothetical protein
LADPTPFLQQLAEAGITAHIETETLGFDYENFAAFVRYQVAGSPLATHVAQVDDAVREALIREVTDAMQSYLNDDGLAFPIEGQIAVAQP